MRLRTKINTTEIQNINKESMKLRKIITNLQTSTLIKQKREIRLWLESERKEETLHWHWENSMKYKSILKKFIFY